MSAGQPLPPTPPAAGKPVAAKRRAATPKTLSTAIGRAAPAEEGRRLALAILEVLAGIRSTTEAAKALSISLPRYYALEARAVEGLVRSCDQPRKRGKSRSPAKELDTLRREMERLERECARQRALARAAQRTLGLASIGARTASDRPGKEEETKRRRRASRPTPRALLAAKALGPAPAPGGAVPPAKPKS